MPIDDPVSQDTVVWAARQVVRQHTESADPNRVTGRCGQCREEGCVLLGWAAQVLTDLPPSE